MTSRFDGATVMITGAAGGLGRAAAERFAREGARLVLGDRDEAGLRAVVDDLRGRGSEVASEAGDVAVADTAASLVRLAMSAFGRLDVAVNNAGILHPFLKLVEIDAEVMERMLSVNVMGVFHGLKHQIPAMETAYTETGRVGAILNVASVAGLVGAPLLSAYAAAKHAVVGLTRSAAAETARRGVRVNAVCPAFTRTKMVMDSLHGMRGTEEEAVARIVSSLPMRRLGEPAEVVEAMLWICSPHNSFMTGQAIAVDGGLTAV